jgi:hypothetical protein
MAEDLEITIGPLPNVVSSFPTLPFRVRAADAIFPVLVQWYDLVNLRPDPPAGYALVDGSLQLLESGACFSDYPTVRAIYARTVFTRGG